MTTFIVYAPIPPGDVVDRLGQPEYSYGFVLSRFRPLLDKLGTVRPVTDPQAEVDAIYDECDRRGEPCVFLCFAPPHRAPIGLRCPTSTVFAWEFETIPDHAWGGEPRNDWRTVLADHGRAIVLSQHTAAAVRRAMGADFPVAAIPAPLFDHFTLPPLRTAPPTGARTFSVTGTLIDNQEFTFTDDGLAAEELGQRLSLGDWDGTRIDLETSSAGDGPARLVGFYHPEPWGTWSRVAAPAVMLPVAVQGAVEIDLVAHGMGVNAGRTIQASLGGQQVAFRLPPRRSHVRLHFEPAQPATVLQFHGIRADIPPGLDERTMGMGLTRVTIRRRSMLSPRLASLARRLRGGPITSPGLPARRFPITVSGVLYTSVLNPVDHRKNWPELVSAFCWALRGEPAATLLLKMTHHSVAAYASDLQEVLHRIGPTRCRVLVFHGFLPDKEFEDLISATTFYANASSAEGLCMPLMEFMSAGVPAVATNNTAMADYLTSAAAFIVESSPGYTHWPHDDRQLIRACEYRVNWESLAAAFRRSFDVATQSPQVYAQMATAAHSSLAKYCSDEAVATALRDFLKLGGR